MLYNCVAAKHLQAGIYESYLLLKLALLCQKVLSRARHDSCERALKKPHLSAGQWVQSCMLWRSIP